MNAQKISNPITPFELDDNYSASYQEVVDYYEVLCAMSPKLQMDVVGSTDVGKPLHTITISHDGDFDPESNIQKGKTILFVNNAIHPGEPCGVDASMMFVRDVALGNKFTESLENITIVVIPFYNVGGGLNRGSSSRANQNGPKFYGFRGNAKNLDLNRDFIKMDSKNAWSFNDIFTKWNPHVFIDNHTSNGADYQYTLTLIATQKDKLAQPICTLMTESMLPFLYTDMKQKNWEMIPYVMSMGTPDNGIIAFNETPRYSTGYAALHHTIGFMPETHMLKPFKDRVESVYQFMISMLQFMDKEHEQLKSAKQAAERYYAELNKIPLNWSLNKEEKEKIEFHGYEAKQKPSDISGLDRLYYDRDDAYTKQIDYLVNYNADLFCDKPKQYIVPQGYTDVIDRLKLNGVVVTRLEKDQVIDCQMHYIKDYSSRKQAYESHFLHYGVETELVQIKKPFFEGDFVIHTGQTKDRLIVELLEPNAVDSYFAWNFFDGILMQKEHFSDYVFEDLASQILAESPDIKTALEAKKLEDSEFAKDGRAQLNFIYQQSQHFEPTYLLYPVGRVF